MSRARMGRIGAAATLVLALVGLPAHAVANELHGPEPTTANAPLGVGLKTYKGCEFSYHTDSNSVDASATDDAGCETAEVQVRLSWSSGGKGFTSTSAWGTHANRTAPSGATVISQQMRMRTYQGTSIWYDITW